MRKTLIIALGAAIALVTAAVAMAAVFTASGVSSTTATLSATQPSDVSTRTCTGADGKAFSVSNGRYAGTATFNTPAAASALSGALTLHLRTTVDTGAKLGYVEGTFRIKNSVSGVFSGTLNDTTLTGFLNGGSRGNHARVLGTLTGTFSAAAGLSNGSLGAGTPAASAVLAGPVCKGRLSPKPKRIEVHGTLTIGTGSPVVVTVTGKGPTTTPCTVDATSPSLANFSNGMKVEMMCASTDSTTWFLRALKKT
jgi:hypothetical protein